MSQVKNIFGFNDTDESLKGKSGGGKFGLNTGTISLLAFTDKAGKDGAPGNAVDIHFKIGDREYRRRLFDSTGQTLNGKKNTKVAPGEEGYDDLYFEDMGTKIAVIKHALKAVGVTQEMIDKVSATLDPTKITEGLQTLLSLVPADYQNKPVDAFLEYQWNIAEGQDKTYPELPKNMKGGRFLSPSVKPTGQWNEVINEDGLTYVDDAGNVHPFDRNASFMESNKAVQQFADGSGSTNQNFKPTAGNTGMGGATASTWE